MPYHTTRDYFSAEGAVGCKYQGKRYGTEPSQETHDSPIVCASIK
jgi:hypothetical protein